jgi:pimeloyl-ACP methyl ester carboxylesterase
VLVLHGPPGGYDQGLAAGQVLDLQARIVAPSRPGYLGTPLATGRTPGEQADAVAALLDILGIHRAAVIGASGGGMAAIALAARHPERVSRLVLWQGVAAPMDLDLTNMLRGPLTWDVTGWAMLAAVRRFPRLLLRQVADGRPEQLENLQRLAATSFPLGVRRDGILNDQVQATSLSEDALRTLTVPTLLAHGDQDTNVPPAVAERAAELMPDARLVSVPGGDHTSTLTHPVALSAIRQFLDGRIDE